MTQEQAVAFINSINAIQKYVPPIDFNPILSSPVVNALIAIANGQVICELTPRQSPIPVDEGPK